MYRFTHNAFFCFVIIDQTLQCYYNDDGNYSLIFGIDRFKIHLCLLMQQHQICNQRSVRFDLANSNIYQHFFFEKWINYIKWNKNVKVWNGIKIWKKNLKWNWRSCHTNLVIISFFPFSTFIILCVRAVHLHVRIYFCWIFSSYTPFSSVCVKPVPFDFVCSICVMCLFFSAIHRSIRYIFFVAILLVEVYRFRFLFTFFLPLLSPIKHSLCSTAPYNFPKTRTKEYTQYKYEEYDITLH